MSLLTIAIPTYNRKKYLIRTLKILIPQLTKECEILIIDNCSVNYNIKKELKELIENKNITLKINEVNIGSGANICRCFLESKSKWTWLLGDDDIPSEKSVEIILNQIKKKNNKIIAFKYSYSYLDKNLLYDDEVINNTNELLEKFEDKKSSINFSNFLYMSTFVYKTSEIKKELKTGYETIGTFASQITMLLMSLRSKNNSIQFIKDIIIKNNIVSYEEKWSRLRVGIGIAGILNLNLGLDLKRQQYLINALTRFINIKELFIETFSRIYSENDILVIKEYKKIYKILIGRSNLNKIKLFYFVTRLSMLNKYCCYIIFSRFFDFNKKKKNIEETL